MNKQKAIQKQRKRRRFHVRNKLRGDAQRPRLSVFRSSRHIACQVIDDSQGVTVCAASTQDKSLRDTISEAGNADAAAAIGKAIAERALAAGVQAVRLDRGSYKFHGRVKALADAAREAGLNL